jgi:hypothetical protein
MPSANGCMSSVANPAQAGRRAEPRRHRRAQPRVFQDPSSNAIYKRIEARLPIRWSASGAPRAARPTEGSCDLHLPESAEPEEFTSISGFTFHDQ